ncbi:MAG TPA: S8 family serine peptidase, partial [Allosphingosinicella sp.]|nr:S8 family serine peptidase [Allosphingosinicella sp.]
VAAVAMRALPRASLVPVRITFSDSSPPPLLDEAAARRFAAMVTTAARYMRMRGVRLCNISWGFTSEAVEHSLAQNGVEPDPEARARRAQRIFDLMLEGMTEAIASSPDILFVIAAGNAGQDVDFVRDLPGSINLPNVLTVAAADAQGRAASFASTGASVDLYARGTDVESIVPGGGRLRWSGASLAAPQVVNAAAKLLLIDSGLSSRELARLLVESASPAPGSDLPLLNPRAARAQLRARRGH